MATPQERSDSSQKHSYVVDAESAAEMARLMRQDQVITRGMGGIFPEKIEFSGIERVLDLACGPGGWVLETAFTYTDVEVVGVDISERMVAYASAQAKVQGLPNASFQVMNILQPLNFPDASFDLVNARLIVGFMRHEMWPAVLSECVRILRPGGILRFTEFEPDYSNKVFFGRTTSMLIRAMARGGIAFSPEGWRIGIIPMLPSFFRKAGLNKIGQMAHLVEFSAGTAAHESFYHDMATGYQLVGPFIEKMGVATTAEWEETYKKGLAEMFEDDFCAAWSFLTVWGYKPES